MPNGTKPFLTASRRQFMGGVAAASATIAMPAVVRAQSPMVMKISTPTLNDSQHEWMKIFAREVEANTKGAIKGELYPASQLGSAARTIEGTQLGSIQVNVLPPEFLSGVDSRYELLGAPGLFKDLAHGQRCMQLPAVNSAFLNIGDAKGLRGIGLFVNADAIFNSRNKLSSTADLANKKIRVLASVIQTEQVKRLGGTGVPMTLGEVLPAVQQGTIDGMMGSLPVITALRFYDAAKYILETKHSTVSVISVASKVWYEALPKEHQQIIDAAGQKASQEVFPWLIEFNESSRKVWTDHGGEIISLSPAAHAELMTVMKPIGDFVASRKEAEKALFEVLKKTSETTA